MLPKILWTICGVLIVIGVGVIFRSEFKLDNSKKVSGAKSDEILSPTILPAIVPTKKTNISDPNIAAKAVYLIDTASFYPMYAKEEDQKVPIASTTKMATALVVLENHKDKLQDIVTINTKMISVEGSDIQLLPGEKITVENLLNGLLIMSGNDTAYALADYFRGRDAFVKEMNSKVREIGATNTEYQDPAGLDDKGYSTAKDLALIGSYALRNKQFSEIVKTPEKTINSVDGRITHELKNSNRMLRQEEAYFYPYTIGIKTGFTNEAGHVLVSCAEKDGHKILAVVLNTNENTLTASAEESKKLLEWGFNNFTW